MMIRGFMKTTSLTTLVAAAGILVGNSAYAPANAADLGGSGCCADLEERVAELEATAARKGNRVVSLQVYGQVNRALLIWDDGVDSDVFVTDYDLSGSRIGLQGTATLRPGWTVGYNIEFNYQDSATDSVTQFDDDGNENDISIRKNYLYFESEQLGRLGIGQQSSSADGVNEIVLGNSLQSSLVNIGNLFVRDETGPDFLSGFKVSDFTNNLDGNRLDVIRYDSPSIYGFILSASWGENDYADIALRFKKEWNSIRLAAGIAYQWVDEAKTVLFDDDDDDDDSNDISGSVDKEILSGSISIMHVPTGIFGAFAAGQVEYNGFALDDGDFVYAQLGLERRITPYGSTIFYAEYGDYNGVTELGAFFDLNAELWGVGVVQRFDSAAVELYAHARFWDFENGTTAGDDLEGITTVIIGSRIKF